MAENPERTEELPEHTKVLIIGAGPAGLVLSEKLKKYKQEHVVVEKSGAGASWISMHDNLGLVSPWWTNVLDPVGLLSHWPLSVVTVRDYAKYLQEYRTRHDIQVHENCVVTDLAARADGSFDVRTSKGALVAESVVCATGYFANPCAPEPSYESDGSIPVIHTAKFAGIDEFKVAIDGRPILIVGRRISAGQLMLELHDAGYSVCLSCRDAVQFRRDGLLGWLKDTAYYFYEEFLLRRRPNLQAESFPPMDGGRSRVLIESGLIGVHPLIKEIRNGVVEFHDGTTLEAGLVINATGYRPALPCLPAAVQSVAEDGVPSCSDWESVDSSRLYFLGLANCPNYASRTLRGIRRDAGKLAELIAHSLR